MKYSLISFSLILVLAQLPFGDFNPKEPEEDKTPVKGWWMVSYFSVPPTQYSKAGKAIIKAESLGSRSSLFKEVGEKERDFRVLSWRWKISNVVHSAIETRKERFDAAARVMVVFGKEKGFKIMEGMEPRDLKSNISGQAIYPKVASLIIRERNTARFSCWSPEREKQDNGSMRKGMFVTITNPLLAQNQMGSWPSGFRRIQITAMKWLLPIILIPS